MVAVIKSSPSIANALHYNENKVKAKVAELFHSSGFLKDFELLSFKDKIKHFQKLTELNQRTKLNSVHISLNFDPSEKLEVETLRKIADTYMKEIGFGKQPYLVYEHRDSGHPHIHIVTTNIQGDGTRINMQNIGRNQSETARKAIEIEFKLVQADSCSLKASYEVKPISNQKIQYGKVETQRAITNVLDAVLLKYKYSSLPEFNAVLKGYNVTADRGSKESRTYKNKGLHYRILNDKGKKIGVPIKASLLYNNPGMKFLEKKFAENEPLKQPHKLRTKNAIDFYFLKHDEPSLTGLNNALQKERIQVLVRENEQGLIYGMTYVDHQTKCVFNGSQLGKQYSVNAILQRCHKEAQIIEKKKLSIQAIEHRSVDKAPGYDTKSNHIEGTGNMDDGSALRFLHELTQSKDEGSLASELLAENKREKRKRWKHS